MAYRAPVEDIIFSLKHAAGLAKARADGLYQDLSDDDLDVVLGEAGRFASEVLAPLNAAGDRYGTPFRDGEVTMPPGWKEAYRDWAAAGWNGVAAPTAWGGQGLPRAGFRCVGEAVRFWRHDLGRAMARQGSASSAIR